MDETEKIKNGSYSKMNGLVVYIYLQCALAMCIFVISNGTMDAGTNINYVLTPSIMIVQHVRFY